MPEAIIRERLLFVDDEQRIRLALPPILAKKGFDVKSSATAQDALALIRTVEFDILLTDLNLPEVDAGFAIVEEMRKVQPYCLIFILTGFPAQDSFKRARELDVAHYFVKPVAIEEMLKTIRQKIDARHRRSAPEPATNPGLKYPWQQAVLAALMEVRPECLPAKINAAERAVSARLCDPSPADLDEHIALQDALKILRVLFPEAEGKKEPGKKEDIA